MRPSMVFAVLTWASIAGADTIPVNSPTVGPGLLVRHPGERLSWEPTFASMKVGDYVVFGTSAAIALATAIAPPIKTGWSARNDFDNAMRDALRLRNYQSQIDVRDASDVGLAFITSFPILVDSLIVSYWYRGSRDAAFQMFAMDAEAFALAGAVQGTVSFLAGRERPYGADCGGALSSSTVDCTSNARYRSFFSGHSTLSFTSAALICSHHQMLRLFDSAADPITCGSAFALAAGVALFRVIGDMHYATDILVGAAVGTAIGFGVPLLHRSKKKDTNTTSVTVVPGPGGIAVGGTF